jgi:hypothetical protein
VLCSSCCAGNWPGRARQATAKRNKPAEASARDAAAIFGILAYNQWSFAGKDSAQSVNLLNAQPIYVKHTSWGYWGWTDQPIAVDWENNLSSVPLGLRFGNVIKFGSTPAKLELGF